MKTKKWLVGLSSFLVSLVVVVSVLKVAFAQDAVADDPKAIVTQYYDEIANQSDSVKVKQAMDTLLGSHFEFYPPNNVDPATGSLVHLEFLRVERTTFPDLEWTVVEMIAEDNAVAVRWTVTGTQEGDFQGLPPTGNKIDLFGMDYFKLEDGHIAELHRYFDVLTLARQLGIYK